MTHLRLMILFLFTLLACPMGCSKNPDATGEAGIGAPGTPPAQIPSEEELRQIQLKQDEAYSKSSNKVR
jgi:hypothetical protein